MADYEIKERQLAEDFLSMDLLWENASPTSSFSPQVVDIPWERYRIAIINFRIRADVADPFERIVFIKFGETSQVFYIDNAIKYKTARGFTIVENGISFSDGYINDTTRNSNDQMIPTRIYGIK